MGTQENGGDRKVCCGQMNPSQSSGLRFPFGFYDFISGGGWQPRVAGGGVSIQPSTQPSNDRFPSLSSIQPSVICHRLSHLSISGGRWQPLRAGGGKYAPKGNRRPDDWLGSYGRSLKSGFPMLPPLSPALPVSPRVLRTRSPLHFCTFALH